jgi:hypothetical protein
MAGEAMGLRIVGIVALGVALAGCSVTLPVAVISKNGQILRGTATAGLAFRPAL